MSITTEPVVDPNTQHEPFIDLNSADTAMVPDNANANADANASVSSHNDDTIVSESKDASNKNDVIDLTLGNIYWNQQYCSFF